jgi:hypothetical protein
MAEPTQFSFTLEEVTQALIKHQGLHEGLWTLSIEFGLGSGIVGPTPTEGKPSAIVAVNRLQLVRPLDMQGEQLPFTQDASKVNPKVSKTRK